MCAIHQQHRKPTDIFDILLKYAVLKLEKSKYQPSSTTPIIFLLVNGNWGWWGNWTHCTKTCIGGTRIRYRTCDNPSPVNGGSPCLGLDTETGSCSTAISCPGMC